MIIMILGMHRSGTSTISGVLHMNQIIMGTYQNFWPRPLSQNPKGFYENYDFRKINDQLLNRSGYDVESYSENIPEINVADKLLNKMKALIEKSNLSYANWGWKDPRTCLTAMHWANAIEELDLGKELKIIFMAFFGGVVGNITSLVSQLGNAGLAGLISLGVVLWLFQR